MYLSERSSCAVATAIERPWLFSIVCGMIAQFGLILVTSCIDRTSFLNDILIGWSFMLFAYPLQAILNNIEGGPVIGLFIELLMSTFTVFVYGLIIYALLKVVKKIKGKYINY